MLIRNCRLVNSLYGTKFKPHCLPKKVCKYSRNSFSLEKMLTFTANKLTSINPNVRKEKI
jgi:hypothetical protein